MDAEVARGLLEEERTRLLRVRRGLHGGPPAEAGAEGLGPVAYDDDNDDKPDDAGEVFERQAERSILAQVDGDLQEVAEALARLADASFGRCQACGQLIPDDRLEAVPATRFCLGHEESWERGLGPQVTVDEGGTTGPAAERGGP